MNLYRSNKKGGTTPTGNKAITINSVGTTSGIDVANYATASVTTDGLYKPSGIKDNSGSSYTTNGTKTITGLENYTGVKFDVAVSASMSETILWTNSDTTTSFAAQNITVSDSWNNYSYIKFVFHIRTTVSVESIAVYPVSYFTTTGDDTTDTPQCATAVRRSGREYRRFWYNGTSSVHFHDAINITSSNIVDNTCCIPAKIIGMK